jgi:hypothetical protein
MKLASIEQIKDVKPHPNADRLDLVYILGYQLVCAKGLYNPGDVVVYIQPDTILPEQPWAESYRKYSPKRVKAIKLRNEWSEGIVVPSCELNGILAESLFFENASRPGMVLNSDVHDYIYHTQYVGMEVSHIIGVYKYEPPLPQDLSAKGPLPFTIPVTDEERWENLDDKIPFGSTCDVTLKVDGQSCSFYYNIETDTFGVLGRRFEYKEDVDNKYTAHLKRYPYLKTALIDYCKKIGKSLCIRGESYGPGIQGGDKNPFSKGASGWAMFSVYNITDRQYERLGSELYFRNVAAKLDLPTVRILSENIPITKEMIDLYSSNMKTLPNGNMFEGVVINYKDGSFKIINKHYDSENEKQI